MAWSKGSSPKGTGRSATKYCYTAKDIADATGHIVQTVQYHIRKGILDITDIGAVAEYIVKRKK